jgi:hypothetical protein
MTMATERINEIWDSWKESSEKFDYFMAGLCCVLTAYVGQNLNPIPIGLNPSSLELVALGPLCGSVVMAFKRIERLVILLGAMSGRIYNREAAGFLISAALKIGKILNKSTREILSPNDAMVKAEEHGRAADEWELSIIQSSEKAARAYRWRNRLLYVGFSLLVVARIWTAYIPTQ